LIHVSSSVDGYRRFLARILGWERGLEIALTRVSLWADRAKSRIIADDLLALGMTAEEVVAIPTCMDAVNAVTDATSTLGWLFAAEGVSFAHGMARHQLADSVRKHATAYFDSLQTRTTWLEVLRSIDEVCDEELASEQVITSATFGCRSKRAWLAASSARPTGRVIALPKNDQIATKSKEP
jgi:heme oxygenase